MLTVFDHALQDEARQKETESRDTDQEREAVEAGEKNDACESDESQHDTGAEIKADVTGFAKSGLDEPGAGAGNVGGRKRNRFAEGIEGLLDALPYFDGGLFLRDGGVAAESAETGSQHGAGGDGGRAEGEDHQDHGNEDDDGENH